MPAQKPHRMLHAIHVKYPAVANNVTNVTSVNKQHRQFNSELTKVLSAFKYRYLQFGKLRAREA